ncbi:Hypothetical predicted protein [Lecanosticta acicola]|uniref:Uncharacterized protein n=1 Tax=Lecanosticta acicola TaxID=111012 RepID=A0AAI8Z3J5_9PEZI|nr:Hypothetical predicted protein [Lecanosticta acicola]
MSQLTLLNADELVMPSPTEPHADTLAPSPPPIRGPSSFSELRTFDDRLSLPLYFRIPLACTIGSVSGLLLGLAKGSNDAGYRFQAENAHRLPTTSTGWYFYHKSKNYNMMLGGVKEGTKQAARYTLWVGMFFILEEGVDRGRAAGWRLWGRVKGGEYKRGSSLEQALAEDQEEAIDEKQVLMNRDCISSMLAGLGTAGIFSAWNRFPLPTAARTAKMGARAGLVFGLLQDAVSLVKGRRVGYVEFVKRHTLGSKGEDDLHLAGQETSHAPKT